MSDTETILRTLNSAESRIRINRLLRRVAVGVTVWIGVAILMKTWDLLAPLDSRSLRLFWIVWWASLVPCLWVCRSIRRPLGETATDVDREAGLADELLSAHWFLSHPAESPWQDLQIERAAAKVSGLDLGRLYPRIVPKASYLAAIGLVLLLGLIYAPLPFAPIAFSEPIGTDLSPAQALIDEIEELLSAANRLDPDATLGEFQQFVESLEGSTLSPLDTVDELGEIQDSLSESNLSVSSLIEGLEEIGADLLGSNDTQSAGEALAEHDFTAAAEALSELAAELGSGRPPDEDLQSALAEAADNDYAGLEQLAEALGDAASSLAGDEPGTGVEDALQGAAESLTELADVVQSQQLRNEAASRMENLQDLLREQMAEAQADAGEPTPGEAGQPDSGSPQEGSGGDSAAQPGPSEGAQPGSMDASSPQGEGSPIDSSMADIMSSEAGEMGDVGAGGGGEMPAGFGISPGQVEGPPTSLEVQLQEALVEAPSTNLQESPEREEESSRREASQLDYRSVTSELTRAQQDMLNQDRIPREYRNLIRDYFEAIQRDPEGGSEP